MIRFLPYYTRPVGPAKPKYSSLRRIAGPFHCPSLLIFPFALSLSKGHPFMVRQAHHERTTAANVNNQKTRPALRADCIQRTMGPLPKGDRNAQGRSQAGAHERRDPAHPLRLGYRRPGRVDVDDQRLHPFLRLRSGAPPSRPRRHGVELCRSGVRFQPSMVPLRLRRPVGRLGRRPLRCPPHNGCRRIALHHRHDAHRHHDPYMAVLSLLRNHPGHRNDHLPSAAYNPGRVGGSGPTWAWRWALSSLSRASES